jgi:hypothetical protein
MDYQMTLLKDERKDKKAGDGTSAFRLAKLNDKALK